MYIPKGKEQKILSTSPLTTTKMPKNNSKPNPKLKKNDLFTGKSSTGHTLISSQHKKTKADSKKVRTSNLGTHLKSQSILDLQHLYHKQLNEYGQDIKWLVPRQEQDVDLKNNIMTFPQYITKADFTDLNNLKLNFLHFVCQRRIIKDEDFQFNYELLVIKFPEMEEQIKKMMIEVLAILDS